MMDNQDPNLFTQVFDQKGALIALFGGMGGLVRALYFKMTVAQSVRIVLIGSLLSFGVGILGPQFLKPIFGDISTAVTATIGALTAMGFLIGLTSVTLLERFLAKDSKEVDK